MKPNHLVLACVVALVLVSAVPGFVGRDAGRSEPTPLGVEASFESAVPCRLAVEVGPRTTVDRGPLVVTDDLTIPAASFRYWHEPTGPVLYLYDDVQDLVGRVLHPVRVRVVGEVPAE